MRGQPQECRLVLYRPQSKGGQSHTTSLHALFLSPKRSQVKRSLRAGLGGKGQIHRTLGDAGLPLCTLGTRSGECHL